MVLNQMPDYECILVLRALSLKENNPERWMRLMNLDAPLDEYFENESASVFINNSIKFVREICGLKQYPDSLIRRVASICFLNAFFNDDHPGDNGHIYKYVNSDFKCTNEHMKFQMEFVHVMSPLMLTLELHRTLWRCRHQWPILVLETVNGQ